MKLNAVGVSSSNMQKTITFYSLLGIKFPEVTEDQQHIDSLSQKGSTRLIIDTHTLTEKVHGKKPLPSNHAQFAIEYDSPAEIDEIVTKLKETGFTVLKEPWKAFWGQYYAVIADPDGYIVDLYCNAL